MGAWCASALNRARRRGTRILAISGYIDDDEAKMLTDYGFDDYMKKPFSLSELGDRVEKMLALPASKIVRPKSQV